MGDRANIFLVTEQSDDSDEVRGIYLYTHWGGYEWPETLRQALDSAQARDRWSDDQYLARIIASLVFDEYHTESTGAGISTRLGDNEHLIIVCDLATQRVGFCKEGSEANKSSWTDLRSFTEFCALPRAKYPDGD